MKQNTFCSVVQTQEKLFSNVMINIMKDNEDYTNLTCINGHLFLEQTFKTMTRFLFQDSTSIKQQNQKISLVLVDRIDAS